MSGRDERPRIVSIAEGAALLRRGGIVAYPTETFYGLGALASRADALARLAEAKLRPAGKPLPLIAGDMAQVLAVASLDDDVARALASRFWPGPLTLVLPCREGVAQVVAAGTRSVGVRIPADEVAATLALQAGGALVSTSANVSGEPPVTHASEISPALDAHLDAVVDGRSTPGGRPSTVVQVEHGRLRLLREGAIEWREVEAVAARHSGA
jgi:L-threonylcarbamoyladenylate synthase